MRHLFLTNRFFSLFGLIALLFVISYAVPVLFPACLTFFCLALVLTGVDLLLLFQKNIQISAHRKLPKLLSLGDANRIDLVISNRSPRKLFLNMIDELPFQLQQRDFEMKVQILPGEDKVMCYEIVPDTRGMYGFGSIYLYASTSFQLLQRRIKTGEPTEAPVYPSVLQMKHYESLAFNRLNVQQGLRKIRRIGHSYEFEQIKNYVRGDDYRSVNWKATGRFNKIMVNQYEDERSQQIYCLIDKSRAMKMPFHGMSLMDYAINTTLAISNIALKKYDKAGLITFSDKIGATVKADRKANQLHKILHALYNEQERPLEANYELLYPIARKLINGRSLVFLYTNFESRYALDRVLPFLRRINRLHLLVVVFFENTEIQEYVNREVKTTAEIYTNTVARNFLFEKRAMAQHLNQHGIQTILTTPENLSLHTVSKYLELKSRGMI